MGFMPRTLVRIKFSNSIKIPVRLARLARLAGAAGQAPDRRLARQASSACCEEIH